MSYASIGGATSFMIDEEKKGLKPEINHSDNSMNMDSPHLEQRNFQECSIHQHNNILNGRYFSN